MTLETTRISLIHQETGVLMNLMATGFSLSGHSSCRCEKRSGWNIETWPVIRRRDPPDKARRVPGSSPLKGLLNHPSQRLTRNYSSAYLATADLRMINIKKKRKEQRDEEPSCWLYHPTIINIIKYTVPLTAQLHSLPNLVIPEALRPMTCLWKRNSFSTSHLSQENRRFRCRPWAENPDFRIENDRNHGNFTAMFHHGDSLFQNNLSDPCSPQFLRMIFSALGKNRWVGLLNFTMYHHPPHLESTKNTNPSIDHQVVWQFPPDHSLLA